MGTFAQKAKETLPHVSAQSTRSRPAHIQGRGGERSILDLQRMIGNQAVQRLMASRTGPSNGQGDIWRGSPSTLGSPLTRNAAQIAAGDQLDESEGVALGGEPDSAGAVVEQEGALGGDATSISTSTLPSSGPQWGNNGQFKWWIKWITDGTSGWIVQKIENTYSGKRADGTAITNASLGVTPSYYEAWEVASNGTITGSLGATGNRDRWDRPALGALGSDTSFSMKGTVYWTSTDPALSGFTSGGVTNAGTLLSSTTAPKKLGSALLTRNAHGTWVSSGAPALPGCFTS